MSKQKLNSLEQFRKQSPRLLLEQHSHCEVPAGCGGVAMRWRNPLQTRPLSIRLYTVASATAWLDGEQQNLGRFDIRPGPHVLVLEIDEVDLAAGLLMAVLEHDPGEKAAQSPTPVKETPLKILSAGDGSWKCTLVIPPDACVSLDFDDRDWTAMVERAIPEVSWDLPGGYQYQHCNKEKARGLGVPALPGVDARFGRVWVRKMFEVPLPGAG